MHGSVPLAILYAVLVQLDYLGMAFVYVAGVVLLVQRPRWRRVLGVIAPLGRMPLTTYVSQSLVATFVFYHWGLGWAGSVSAVRCLASASRCSRCRSRGRTWGCTTSSSARSSGRGGGWCT